MSVRSFIAYYIKIVLEGDLKKMLAVARDSQEADRREALSREMATPAATTMTTTMSPDSPSFYNQFNPDRARCAAPISMTLFSVIDVMGTLLKTSLNTNTRESIKVFFDYAYEKAIIPHSLTDVESGVLNQVFRNGSMHSFFPAGMDVQLDLNETNARPLLLTESTRKIALNVNFLQEMVIKTVYALFDDTSKHSAMQSQLDAWETATYNSGNTKARLDEFWNNRPY